jgi:hypothetical protein
VVSTASQHHTPKIKDRVRGAPNRPHRKTNRILAPDFGQNRGFRLPIIAATGALRITIFKRSRLLHSVDLVTPSRRPASARP